MKKIFLISAILLTASCTHYNQKVKLDIDVEGVKPSATANKVFELSVIDQRKNPEILGTKRFGDEKIEISSDKNLAGFLYTQLTDNLVKKGFKLGKGKKVELSIETFEYKAKRGFVVGKSSAEINLKLVVKNPNGKKFTRNFDLVLKNKHFIAPLESTDQATINSILQETVQNILSDDAFLQSLSE